MIRAFNRFRAVFIIVIKRLAAQRGLTLATSFGLVTAVALLMNVPLYADAVYYRVLQEELSQSDNNSSRPPFSYMFDYVGAWYGARPLSEIEAVTDYLRDGGARRLGLPLKQLVTHYETPGFKLYAQDETAYSRDNQLGIVNFAHTSELEAQIDLVEGRMPAATAAGPVEVLVTEAFASEVGIQVGEQFTLYDFQAPADTIPLQIPIQVAGIWHPKDPGSGYWFFAPAVFNNLLYIPAETLSHRIVPLLDEEITLGLWYLVMDGSRVDTQDVGRLLSGAAAVERQMGQLIPDSTLRSSPVEALGRYSRSTGSLSVLLYAFNVPVTLLVLAFIALVVGLAVNERRSEIAVMRSRGATSTQIVSIAALESVLLALVALAAGTVLALLLTQLMGRTRSFLDFSADTRLRVALNGPAIRIGLVAMGLALLAQVWPTVTAAKLTVVTYRMEKARVLRRPWWQRAWLDLLLAIPAGYGFYQLQQQGSLLLPASAAGGEGSLFQNPLLFLVPALAVLAVTLFFLRLLPLLMRGFSWLLGHTKSVGLLLASRQLARAPGLYFTPLILLVSTVSLSVFTASLARTLDLHLFDQMFYKVGSDIRLYEAGQAYIGGGLGAEEAASAAPTYYFLPVSEYEEIDGVAAAARVGRYRATGFTGGDRARGIYLGVDRVDFGQVGFWRYDFAEERLGSLMNSLALSPDAVLVSRGFLEGQGLSIGDMFRLQVRLLEDDVDLNAQIVGVFDYFPGYYPEQDGAMFVGNLETIFEAAGGEMPHHIWLRTAGGLDNQGLDQALAERRLGGWLRDEPQSRIAAEQVRPERQGLFGLLSVGFVAAAILTVLGFFLYALFSFRRRFIELGVWRAVGLSIRQMVVFLASELGFLIVSGGILGTGLGIWISRQFIPFLQMGESEAALVPPYLVEIAWPAVIQVYILFGGLFVVTLLVLSLFLVRMKIFHAVKLGETI